jgi:hypothetical protein
MTCSEMPSDFRVDSGARVAPISDRSPAGNANGPVGDSC